MNEFELIAKLTPHFPSNNHVVRGAGDDCAVLDLGSPTDNVLFKTDAMVEGVHFTMDHEPELIGRKALGRALSDIAAMAGRPVSCLVTIGLPKGFDPEFVVKLYDGLNRLAAEFGVAVSGGETTFSPEKIFISISLVGLVEKSVNVNRSSAKAGEGIFVTGDLGGSLDGKHFNFTPRIKEALWLVKAFPVSAIMDISDGLAGDLRHIASASGVGAELHASAIPISRAARAKTMQESSIKPPLLAALTDGEDFELLFTLPSGHAVRLLDQWKENFPDTRLSCIGKITSEPGLRLRTADGIRPLIAHGYTHFSQS
ncbi:MAG: thiamine-phosphate kinase [Verrucomicrobiales bacterium]